MILEKATYVYEFSPKALVPEQKFKFTTFENKAGICAVNGSKDMSVFAGLTEKEGEIEVIHFDRDTQKIKIQAHKSHISALALNYDGSLVATASQKG